MRTTIISGTVMYCAQSSNPCPKFDRSLLAEAYHEIGERIYGHSEQYYLDQEGRQWISEALIGKNLARYFLDHPMRYLALIQRRAMDFSVMKKKLHEAHTLLTASTALDLARAIRLSSEAYVLVKKYSQIAQPIAECWCDELRTIVLCHLSKREANSYLTSILEAPATAEAVKCGFVEDTGDVLRVDAAKSPPIVVFAETIFPNAIVMDAKLYDRILHSGDSLAKFWSLRTLAPIAMQLAEESRYADYSLRTHLRHFLDRISAFNLPENDPYKFEWRDLVSALEGNCGDTTRNSAMNNNAGHIAWVKHPAEVKGP